MKLMKRWNWLLPALALAMALTACGEKPPAEGASPEQTAEAFLKQFYTADWEGRYTEFASAEAGEEAVDAYHAGLAQLATPELIRLLEDNRTLSRYDRQYEGTAVTVDSVELGEPDGGVYAFTVAVTAGGTSAQHTGQITVQEAGGSHLVSNFWPL